LTEVYYSGDPITVKGEKYAHAVILPMDGDAARQAQSLQNNLTKPAGSLGRLEEISIQLAGIPVVKS